MFWDILLCLWLSRCFAWWNWGESFEILKMGSIYPYYLGNYLNYPEGSRTWPGYVLLRLAPCLLSFHCWRGRQGETHRTGDSLRFKTPLAHSVVQALECFLVMVMSYEERISTDFFLLPESLDPNSLTLAFPSQPLYSSRAPPTCLIFGFYHWVYREKHL